MAQTMIETPRTLDEGDGNGRTVRVELDGGGAVRVGYLGVVLTDSDGVYLGCLSCEDEITEVDAGWCRGCREDMARAELDH